MSLTCLSPSFHTAPNLSGKTHNIADPKLMKRESKTNSLMQVKLSWIVCGEDFRIKCSVAGKMPPFTAIASPNQRRDLLQALFAYVALQVDDRTRASTSPNQKFTPIAGNDVSWRARRKRTLTDLLERVEYPPRYATDRGQFCNHEGINVSRQIEMNAKTQPHTKDPSLYDRDDGGSQLSKLKQQMQDARLAYQKVAKEGCEATKVKTSEGLENTKYVLLVLVSGYKVGASAGD
ncbi:hypothetical protein Tco_1062325 [Tanacetum coccineum]